MILAQKCFKYFAPVVQVVIEIHDLNCVLKTLFTHILQAIGSIDEQHHLADGGHAPSQRLLTQAGAKFIDGLEAGDIGRRFPVSNRVALLVNLVLSEHASQVRLVGLGGAIALLACSSFQLLAHHRHAFAFRADIHNGSVARARLSRALLPTLRVLSDAPNDSLNLPGRDFDTASLLQVPLGFEVGRLIGSLQAEEFGQGWSVADFQTQTRIGRIMALFFALVIIVVAAEPKTSEDSLQLNTFPTFSNLPGFGLISRIDALSSLLEQPAHQFIGRFENRRAHQNLQLSNLLSMRLTGLKGGNQLLDFLLLAENDLGGEFFFESAMVLRVCSMTESAYWVVNCWYCS